MFQILIPLSLLVRVWISRFYTHQRTTATSPPLLVRVWISRVETIEMGSTAFLPAHARVWIFSLLADPQRENGFLLAHVHVWISRFSRFAATSRSFSSRTCAYRYDFRSARENSRSRFSSRTCAYRYGLNGGVSTPLYTSLSAPETHG